METVAFIVGIAILVFGIVYLRRLEYRRWQADKDAKRVLTPYTWRTWSGSSRDVLADEVVFAPEHVVFKRDGRIVLAVKNSDIGDLRPVNGTEGEIDG